MVTKQNFVEIRLANYFPYSLACQFFCCKKQVCRANRGFGQRRGCYNLEFLLNAE
jgi:hypothetical protein